MKKLLILGALLMASAVILGAFGAHGLKARLSPDLLQVYHTGVEYHFYHALGVLLMGVIAGFYPTISGIQWSGWMLTIGIIIFSGSLYLLSITGVRWLGAITPIGGVAFIAGWLMLAYHLYKHA